MVGGVATSDRLVEPGGGGTCASDIAEAGTDAGRLNMEETDNNKQKPYRALLTVLAGFNKDLCCISEECLAQGYNRDVQPLAEMDLTKPLSGTSTMSSSLLDFSSSLPFSIFTQHQNHQLPLLTSLPLPGRRPSAVGQWQFPGIFLPWIARPSLPWLTVSIVQHAIFVLASTEKKIRPKRPLKGNTG